jgi:hypothetical protein
MRDYRAYILGIDGHRFLKVQDFQSDQPDDAAALRAAKQLVDGHDVELWDCGRLVARLSANGEMASPELAPFMAAAASSEGPDKVSLAPDTASDVVRTQFPENHLLLGW